MRYYIYPGGVNGKAVLSALEILDVENEYILIDDCFKEHNFTFLCDNIKDSEVVLIASKFNYEEFSNKLKEQKIYNFVNGIEWVGDKINSYIRKQRNSDKKAIGVVFKQEMIIKNFYGIDKGLEKNGYELVYIVGTTELYNRYHNNHLCILAKDVVLEEVDSLDLIIVACGEPINPKVKSLNLTHGYQGVLHYPFMAYSDSDKNFLRYAAERNTYVSCGGKKICRGYGEFFKHFNLENRAVGLGYLNLTQTYKDYNYFLEKNKNFNEDVIIIGFSFLTLEDHIKDLISGLLRMQKKIFIMAHPIFKKQVDEEIIPLFSNNTCFLHESDFESRNEIFARSIYLITDSSSVGYTYPLVTGKRCIVWIKNKEEYWHNKMGEEHYFDPRLHLLSSNVQEVLEIIDEIPSSAVEFRNVVQKYREQECFYFYDSREKTLEFINGLLK